MRVEKSERDEFVDKMGKVYAPSVERRVRLARGKGDGGGQEGRDARSKGEGKEVRG